jgi:salicylate hydroxylase
MNLINHSTQSVFHRDGRLRLHIVIVGCGIGGLSAAYCLGRAGHRITVLERASEIADVGAGIQVSWLKKYERTYFTHATGRAELEPSSHTLGSWPATREINHETGGDNLSEMRVPFWRPMLMLIGFPHRF